MHVWLRLHIWSEYIFTWLYVAYSICQILMHSERVKYYALDMHSIYAFVFVTVAAIQFLMNFCLSPLHVMLHNSASVLMDVGFTNVVFHLCFIFM